MLPITCHQGNANQTSNEVPLLSYQKTAHPTRRRGRGAPGSHVSRGVHTSAATLEGGLQLLTKLNTLSPYDPAICSLVFTEGDENLCPHISLHMDGYGGSTHNGQSLEATNMPFCR